MQAISSLLLKMVSFLIICSKYILFPVKHYHVTKIALSHFAKNKKIFYKMTINIQEKISKMNQSHSQLPNYIRKQKWHFSSVMCVYIYIHTYIIFFNFCWIIMQSLVLIGWEQIVLFPLITSVIYQYVFIKKLPVKNCITIIYGNSLCHFCLNILHFLYSLKFASHSVFCSTSSSDILLLVWKCL